MRASSWSAALACLWVVGAAAPVRAGLPEDLRDVVFSAHNPDCYAVIYAQVGGGLVLTCDGGESFGLLCASAILGELNLDGQQPHVAYTDDGHLVMGHFGGLFRADEGGCGIERVPGELGETVIRDVVTDPSDPGRTYALSSKGASDNGIHVTTDGGQSWASLGDLEPFFFSSLGFAPLDGDAQRMVVSLGKPAEDFRSTAYFVRVSDDGFETFEERPFIEAESMSLLGVDQQDPDRFYVLATLDGEEREAVYVSASAGQEGSWERIGEVQKMGSFVAPPEGGFWAADVLQRQLLHSEDGTDMQPVDADARDMSCYARRPSDEQAFVCRTVKLYEADGEAQSEGDPLLDLFTLGSFVSCEEPVAPQCQAQLSAGWCSHHFVDAPVCGPGGADAGVPPDGGTGGTDDGGGGSDDGSASDGGADGSASGGCSASRRPTPGAFGWVLLAWVAARFASARRGALRS